MSDTHPLIEVRLPGQVTRREAMQWVLAAVASAALPTNSFGQLPAQELAAKSGPSASPTGYGLDADLVKVHHPGAFWPLTLTENQKRTTTALADLILPKDQYGPAASDVGVPAMVDEWISAPYPQQQADRPIILQGLDWIDAETTRRFGKQFSETTAEQKRAICDDICTAGKAKPPFKLAAKFFSRFRSLCAGAYYGTPAGWEAIGYVGNVPLAQFDGPPAEVLEKLGVTQTVK